MPKFAKRIQSSTTDVMNFNQKIKRNYLRLIVFFSSFLSKNTEFKTQSINANLYRNLDALSPFATTIPNTILL